MCEADDVNPPGFTHWRWSCFDNKDGKEASFQEHRNRCFFPQIYQILVLFPFGSPVDFMLRVTS